MKVTVCDRPGCRAVMTEPQSGPGPKVTAATRRGNGVGRFVPVDLCPDCAEDLARWWQHGAVPR